ncbi:hypothetical protein C8R45DRAFT_1213574 [Mycena sanguinolenta]|nr:hypothetical protein C8R45DRAFT_1213574 [Mycena sanguinolenta]
MNFSSIKFYSATVIGVFVIVGLAYLLSTHLDMHLILACFPAVSITGVLGAASKLFLHVAPKLLKWLIGGGSGKAGHGRGSRRKEIAVRSETRYHKEVTPHSTTTKWENVTTFALRLGRSLTRSGIDKQSSQLLGK